MHRRPKSDRGKPRNVPKIQEENGSCHLLPCHLLPCHLLPCHLLPCLPPAALLGRTPRINAYGGRDHWPQCGSALLAGCGVPGGAVIGSSDNHGAYPATRPVNIPELAATVYRLMGINTNTDLRIRPFLGDAVPMAELI